MIVSKSSKLATFFSSGILICYTLVGTDIKFLLEVEAVFYASGGYSSISVSPIGLDS